MTFEIACFSYANQAHFVLTHDHMTVLHGTRMLNCHRHLKVLIKTKAYRNLSKSKFYCKRDGQYLHTVSQ